MNAFVAQIWKELHEGLKWMALCLVLMSAGLVYALYQAQISTPFYGPGRPSLSVMSPMFLIITGFGGAIVAAIIGLSQTLSENRGDKWGFLTHRPVTRSALFRAKAISGLLLYAVATGVPLAGAVWWVATPGHVACPFEWRMTLPAIADLSCGIVYYFLAVMTGMRQARWFNSRTFGFGAGIVCSFALQISSYFWQAELACAIGILIAATAAWGTFVTGGTQDRMPLLGRCAAAVTIFCSAFLLVLSIVGISIGLFSRAQAGFRYVTYEVTNDGRLVAVTKDQNGIVAVSDLHGKVDLGHFDENLPIMSSRFLLTPDAIRNSQGRYRNFDTLNTELASTNRWDRQTRWFYIARLGLVAGYDQADARLLGWLGPDGYTEGATPPAHHFQGALKSQPDNTNEPVLAFDDGAYRLQLTYKITAKIFATPAGEQLLAASQNDVNTQFGSALGDLAQFGVVLTNRSLYVLDVHGVVSFKSDLECNPEDCSQITVTRALTTATTSTFIICDPTYSRTDASSVNVIEMRSNQGPVSRYTLPSRWTATPVAWPPLILPNVLLATAPLIAWFRPDAEMRLSQHLFKFALLASLISAMFCILVAVIRVRLLNFGRGATAAFLLVTFALGAIGLVWVLSLAERVPRRRCPSCGRWRSARRERCEYCDAAQPLPQMNGTEIFEPALVNSLR